MDFSEALKVAIDGSGNPALSVKDSQSLRQIFNYYDFQGTGEISSKYGRHILKKFGLGEAYEIREDHQPDIVETEKSSSDDPSLIWEADSITFAELARVAGKRLHFYQSSEARRQDYTWALLTHDQPGANAVSSDQVYSFLNKCGLEQLTKEHVEELLERYGHERSDGQMEMTRAGFQAIITVFPQPLSDLS